MSGIYGDLLKEALGKLSPPLATKIYPTPTITNTPRSTPSVEMVKKSIGIATFSFLYANPKFSRCINLLIKSQDLVNQFKGKIFIISSMLGKTEYSYIVAPAAKALEGILLLIALTKGMIKQLNIDNGVPIGGIYDNLNGKPALAKNFVLKGKDKRLVDSIYYDWGRYRNKVLHYDEDFFINSPKEAERCVNEIYETIKLAYQIFIGNPN